MKDISHARRLAVDILAHVSDRKTPFDTAFDRHKDTGALSQRDRAFARNLIVTTLRRRGQIDDVIRRFMKKPVPKKAQAIQHILRLGVCQLVFLKTPAHAAVSTSVELARSYRLHGFAKLINAILRHVEREGTQIVTEQNAAKLNTPKWLWESWCASYGEKTCVAIANAHLEEPFLDLSLNGPAPSWPEGVPAVDLANGTVRLKAKGAVTEIPGYDEGLWWVQDFAAALPVRLLGDVRGKNVIDLCAAPGGKTSQLAAAGAKVTAVDHTEIRMKRLSSNLERLNLDAEIVVADALTWRPVELADAVLLDAPCSATGTIRRHPDILWTKTQADIEKLAGLQIEFLKAASEMVRVGGKVVFCTCSLQDDEGPAIVEQARRLDLPIKALMIDDPVLAPFVIDGDTLRTLPCHMAEQGGMDGFFAVVFERI